MTEYPWLTTLWVLPLAGAVVVLAVPAGRRTVARVTGLVLSLATLAVAIVVAVRFDPGGPQYQLVESHRWIPAFGAGYTLGVDGIALVLLLLTAALVPLLILAGWKDDREAGGGRRVAHIYVALTLIVESMVLISFVSLDILLFYVFFEVMLIPMYFLIGGFGPRTSGGESAAAELALRQQRSRAAVKFLLYNLFGGLIMLAAVIGLYVLTARAHLGGAGGTFDFRAVTAAANSGQLGAGPAVLNALFLGFMFAFAVKAPLWPLHTWLPGAAVSATPASAVLMMAVVDKVGTFGMLRYCLLLFPAASTTYAPMISVLAVIGILYGALLAIGQTDVMRLIAYTSISHFGFIILGIFAMTNQGGSGATLYMVNHGISTAALFLIAGFLVSRRGTRVIAEFGGVQKVAPVLAGTFLIAGLATLSLPGLAPFVSEFLVLAGTFTRYPVAAVFASGALVLAALYVLWMYQRMMTGPVRKGNERLQDLLPRELLVVVPLLAALLVLGAYPKPVLDRINPAVAGTLTTIGKHDPAPTVAPDAATVPAATTPSGGNHR
ncbi:NADH-quinone oxidoreductase subunit M [Nocardia sp. 852002-20019_SCH5090214]|uniref:NADH-quinone oxidoreductase subunit M n=1 Tax=Nocardia nova TaxID=37330 RepID=A0A2S6ADR9_9NOCA|nr:MULTISPECIES: NADH-quinone oxidoreductase subunit M [Nocardia]OBF80177.1 NADH-quinone oxidoreductase subunit M [Mycobacterium sp. 852002-51759_SCH5129042]MBF6273236.1 NADH-quinone oxidoreductase subunit M [Nocardia nova]OBA49041.1 NADH-quinone oxidoreductase subunit M [Nocardia sp. 852002-20019_SCH5090214]OBA49482.1 NADH-quinone oxidoreductase subunit M [Nocardia sp. 852002-51101_SCH5132738]OBB31440.1 NADH-quinone oxidoreductase subunit M [Nocardia sp. 852002-51244_SCH5132740]